MRSNPPPSRERAALFALVVALNGTMVGLFALPVQTSKLNLGASVYVGNLRAYTSPAQVSRLLMSGFAAFWWGTLLLVLAGLLALLVATAVAMPSVRGQVAQVLAALAVATGLLHTLAVMQTGSLEQTLREFRRAGTGFDVPGYGIWVTYAGLAVLAVAAVLLALNDRPAPLPAGEPGTAAPDAGEPDAAPLDAGEPEAGASAER